MTGGAISAADLRELLDRSSQRLFDEGNVDVVDELLDPGFVDHDPLPGQPPGPEGTKWKVRALHAAFPDFRCRNELVLADPELGLATHMYVATGTNTGPYLGAPATGRAVRLVGIDILRFAGGRIVERWGQTDNLSTMRQLGLMGGDEGW